MRKLISLFFTAALFFILSLFISCETLFDEYNYLENSVSGEVQYKMPEWAAFMVNNEKIYLTYIQRIQKDSSDAEYIKNNCNKIITDNVYCFVYEITYDSYKFRITKQYDRYRFLLYISPEKNKLKMERLPISARRYFDNMTEKSKKYFKKNIAREKIDMKKYRDFETFYIPTDEWTVIGCTSDEDELEAKIFKYCVSN